MNVVSKLSYFKDREKGSAKGEWMLRTCWQIGSQNLFFTELGEQTTAGKFLSRSLTFNLTKGQKSELRGGRRGTNKSYLTQKLFLRAV
jgi:hypothetical protein